MKKSGVFVFLVLLINCYLISYSQKTTIGIYSGVNLSDLHGQYIDRKCSSKPGPVQGINLGYLFNKTFGLQTGISYSTIYYEQTTLNSGPIFDDSHFITSPPYYYYGNERMDFSFLRVPLLITVSIPSALKFDLRAGVFYSFLKDYSMPFSYYSDSEISKKDRKGFGYVFSYGVSYPFNENFIATFNTAYMAGPKKFPGYTDYKHGSSEFALGFAYTGFLKNKKFPEIKEPLNDTSVCNITVTYQAGINMSWNGKSAIKGGYIPIGGPLVGFALNYKLGKGTSIQTGISFERKGYAFKDSSELFHRFSHNNYMMYDVDTRVEIDYIEVPLLMNIFLGKTKSVFLCTGPYIDILLNARCVGTAYNESRSGGSYLVARSVINKDMEKILTDNDFGWIVGGGVTLPVYKKYKAKLMLRYSAGFNDIYTNHEIENYMYESTGRSVIKNGTLSFLIGIELPSSDH